MHVRAESDEQIRAANDEWRRTFDAMDEAVALLDADGKILRCNRAMAVFIRKQFQEIIGHVCTELCICLNGRKEQCPVARCRQTLKRERSVLNHADKWFEVSADPILDDSGQFQGSVHILKDITEQKQMEEALRRAVAKAEDEKARAESIIEAIGEGISIQDRDFRILYQNQAHKKIIGEHAGEFCYLAYEKREERCEGCGIAQVFKDGEAHTVQRSAPTDAGLVHVEITASPLLDSKGNIVAGIEVVHNITERKKAEEALRSKEYFLSEAQRITKIGSWQRDLKTDQVIWSDELFRIFGLDPAGSQADFNTLLDLIHPDDREKQRKAAAEAIQNKQPYNTEYRIIRADGSQSLLHAQGEVVCDESGSPVYLRGTAQDITEQRHSELQLQEQKRFSENLIQNSAIATLVLDAEHKVVIWNKACEEMTGIPASEIVGTKDQWKAFYNHERPILADVVLGSERDRLAQFYPFLSESLYCKDGLHAEGWYRLKGIDRYLVFDAAPIMDGDGVVTAAVETLQDITGRKLTEEKLKHSEERYRSVVENAFDMIQSVSPDGHLLYVNPAWLKTMGYTWEELKDRTIFDIIHPACQEKCSTVFNSLVSGMSVDHFETQFTARDGRVIDLEGSASVSITDGRVNSMQCILHDVTERKRLEEELFRSQQDWEYTFNSITDMVTVHDRDYNIILANKAAEKILGLPLLRDMKNRKCFAYYHGTDQAPSDCPSCSCLQSGKPDSFEIFESHLNMFIEIRAIPRFDSNGNLIGLIHVARDITERKKAEAERERLYHEKEMLREQLLQSQKMEAVGTLAGGIAHDFNNILNVIIGYSGLIERSAGIDEKTRGFLQEISNAANRAAYLTRGLLAFSRKQQLELKPADLNDIIRSITAMLHRIIGEDVRMNIGLCDNNPVVICDSGQIEQVVVNLATNARDAMPNGGSLNITTEIVCFDDNLCIEKGFANPGRYAMMRMTDTGLGMDEETVERIFEPFFTTKPVGSGTGLGLSIIYGIVAQHKGYLECNSAPGQGTTFSIYLPLAESAESSENEKVKKDFAARGRGELVLVGEDDESGRRLIRIILEHQGYRVIEASNGVEVMEQFNANNKEISLMLLDVIMPDMNGYEALELISQKYPEAKAILMSGYTSDILAQRGIGDLSVPLLKKPVSPHELIDIVRNTLDGQSA